MSPWVFDQPVNPITSSCPAGASERSESVKRIHHHVDATSTRQFLCRVLEPIGQHDISGTSRRRDLGLVLRGQNVHDVRAGCGVKRGGELFAHQHRRCVGLYYPEALTLTGSAGLLAYLRRCGAPRLRRMLPGGVFVVAA